LTLGNDANAVYDYDIANRLLYLTNNINDINIVFDYNDYDKVGNRKRCKIGDANAHVYTYDCLYQLIYVDYNDGNSTNYWYDSLGNRTSVTNGEPEIYYDRNCLNQYTKVGPQGSQTDYHYDKNGNLTDDDTYMYYYDCENRLNDVNNQSDQPVVSYRYDYLGRRVSKTIHDSLTTIHYTYDGDQVIAEYDYNSVSSDYELARKFIYGPGIDEPICMIDVADGNKVYYYHFDGLGSVVALSDVNSEVVERYSYDVFGEPNTTSSISNPYFFTGRRFDAETGLYYYRARYYSPDTGRFLQTDPIGYLAGLNLYTYVGNNPLNWVDPLGLDWYPPQWAADIIGDIGDAAGWVHDEAMGLWHKTDGIRAPVGTVMTVTGGMLVGVAAAASGPPGWVVGTGLVLTEVGGILMISDLDVWGTAEKVVKPIEELQREREKMIDELFDDEACRK